MNVPVTTSRIEIEIRRSRFISIAGRCDDPPAVRDLIARTRSEHPGCSHVVWAFVSGNEGERFGMSDDHEPKGTAGRPTLEVLRGSGLTNALIQTIRYFGGTKLGTGGLVRAYTQAAQLAVAGLDSEPLVERERFCCRVAYPYYDRFERLSDEFCLVIEATRFGTEVEIAGRLEVSRKQGFSEAIRNLTSGATEVIYPDT